MQIDKHTKCLIVGLGLIGGGYAQALTSKGYEVGAIDINPDSVRYALDKGWIRHGECQPTSSYIGQFDLLVFSLYPHTFLHWIHEYRHMIRQDALLTDVTGVKGGVVYEVQEILSHDRPDLEFIGAHPMAGRERSGVEYADMAIFSGANYIVTPTDRNTPDAIETCKELGRILGFGRISILSPKEHDEMIGFVSQLTHCIAISLMACKDATHLADYTGDSFRDLTRIARINDVMWSELFLMNKKELLHQMDLFTETFRHLRDSLEREDGESIRQMMRLSTERRAYFDKSK